MKRGIVMRGWIMLHSLVGVSSLTAVAAGSSSFALKGLSLLTLTLVALGVLSGVFRGRA